MKASVAHLFKSFPDDAFCILDLFLTFKAGGDEAEPRDEQDMVKDLVVDVIISVL